MATEVRWRRGTTAENDAFTGAEGEITVDMDKKGLRVHDNATQGGHPSLTEEAAHEAGYAYQVDSVSDLQTGSFPASLKRIWLAGFYEIGDGGGGTFYWDETEDKANHNGGTIIDPDHTAEPGDSAWYTAENSDTGCWKRNWSGAVNVLWFGAKRDRGTDNTNNYDAFYATLAAGSDTYIPGGSYLIDLTDAPKVSGFESAGGYFDLWSPLNTHRNIQGDGLSSIIHIKNGYFWFDRRCTAKDFRLMNEDFDGTRGSINSDSYGLIITQSSNRLYNLMIQGFGCGLQTLRGYTGHYNLEVSRNLIGFSNSLALADGILPRWPGDATLIDWSNLNVHVNCRYTNNFQRAISIEIGIGHNFYSCSFESTEDQDYNTANYPDGGVYFAGGGLMESCWVEGSNVFLNSDGVELRNVGGWRNTHLLSPAPIGPSRGAIPTKNLLPSIDDVVWNPFECTLTSDPSYVDNGINYHILSSNASDAAGSKVLIFNIDIPLFDLDYRIYYNWIKYGMWVMFKEDLSDKTFCLPEITFTDVLGANFVFETPSRYNTLDPTKINEWQYIGGWRNISSANLTGELLDYMNFRFRLGLSSTDFSTDPIEIWLSNPELRLWTSPDHPLQDPQTFSRGRNLNTESLVVQNDLRIDGLYVGKRINTSDVSTTPTSIYSPLHSYGNFLVVRGFEGNNRFMDIVVASSDEDPIVIQSYTTRGAPEVRTYTRDGDNLQLAMAANTYSIIVVSNGFT